MPSAPPAVVDLFKPRHLMRDLSAGLTVYFVAVPLCLGIALASNVPLAAGLIAGVVGGIVVGLISGSHTSVAGPAAGLATFVAALMQELGSFQALLVAVVLAGVIQIVMGALRAGFIAAYFPSSVIKGLLAGIGVLIVLKQIPHLVGYDTDPAGELSFFQPDGANTFSGLLRSSLNIHAGATIVGLLALAVLIFWQRSPRLAKSALPGALVVVVLGALINALLRHLGDGWLIGGDHLVQVPVLAKPSEAAQMLTSPDWAMLRNPAIYTAAFTLALIASLETLLNLDAVDQLDREQRRSPPNRELVAQGVGNLISGLIGGLPLTSVIVRSSVNINAGSRSKLSAIFHGVLLLASVLLIPALLNTIPLAALAAILLVTGFKLASPQLFVQMWRQGRSQFVPFAATILLIVMTDLLTGVISGLLIAITFILWSNYQRPLRILQERHHFNEVVRFELASQVSFLNRAAFERALRAVPTGRHVLIDARNTEYIDPDILDLVQDFQQKIAPSHQVGVSLLGFKENYPRLSNKINFTDYSTAELRSTLTPEKVLDILHHGNRRFRTGQRLTRDFARQVEATAPGQAPLAVILSCIDSRTPAEHLFDLGLGDVFSVRIAGNGLNDDILGSIEFGCKVAGAKLIVVMGHTSCGMINAALNLLLDGKAPKSTGCDHLDSMVAQIQATARELPLPSVAERADPVAYARWVDAMAQRHVLRTSSLIVEKSPVLAKLVEQGQIKIASAIYDLRSGGIDFPTTSAT